MDFKNVVVAGGGVLGSQIAYQTAFKGFHVTMWLRSEGSIGRTKPKVERLHEIYLHDLEALRPLAGTDGQRFPRGLVDDLKTLTPEKIDELKKRADDAFASLRFETDMKKAVKDADLIIESVAEDVQAKMAFYTELQKYIPEKTVIVTNSSTMLPSTFAAATGRPEKYLALHFANEIWRSNTAEIMAHKDTDPKYFTEITKFAAEIGMVPLEVKKEVPGYILNSLLIPLLNSGLALWAADVADTKTIDLTWRLSTGAPYGPFQLLDVIGLTTAYNIVKLDPKAQDPTTMQAKIAAKLEPYIEAGKIGVNAGEGFYKYK